MANSYNDVPSEPRTKPSRYRSITRTIRIDDNIDTALIDLAERDRVAVNQIVTVALRRYIEWELLADMAGMISVNDQIVKKLFDSITIEQAREIGRETGSNAWIEILQIMFKTVNYDTMLKFFETCAQYGHWFVFDQTRQSDKDILILKHKQGSKATVFFAEAIKSIFNRIGLKYDITEGEDQLLVTVHARVSNKIPIQLVTLNIGKKTRT